MNTVDALSDVVGKAANFLDTGGKATSETVKKSFQVILQDPRVKVIFVNIFGGLTLGDMIAKGVLLAFQELEVAPAGGGEDPGDEAGGGTKNRRSHTSFTYCMEQIDGLTAGFLDCGERVAFACL